MTTTPQPPSYMPGAVAPTSPAGGPTPRKRMPWILGVVALLVAIAGTVALTLSLSGGADEPAAAAAPAAFRVTGYLSLDGAGTFTWESEENPVCAGREGFDDVKPGAQVVVTDAAGATIAVGTLEQGLASYQTVNGDNLGTSCKFSFVIPDVPAGREFYGVEVTHRGSVKYPEAQLRDQTLNLTLS